MPTTGPAEWVQAQGQNLQRPPRNQELTGALETTALPGETRPNRLVSAHVPASRLVQWPHG